MSASDALPPASHSLQDRECAGHVKPEGGGELNAFGRAFRAAEYRWTTVLCLADSDGDGESNGAELGDPCCSWMEGAEPSRRWQLSNPGDAKKTSSFIQPNCTAAANAASAFAEFYYVEDDRLPTVTLAGMLAEAIRFLLYPLLQPTAAAQRLAGLNPWQKKFWQTWRRPSGGGGAGLFEHCAGFVPEASARTPVAEGLPDVNKKGGSSFSFAEATTLCGAAPAVRRPVIPMQLLQS